MIIILKTYVVPTLDKEFHNITPKGISVLIKKILYLDCETHWFIKCWHFISLHIAHILAINTVKLSNCLLHCMILCQRNDVSQTLGLKDVASRTTCWVREWSGISQEMNGLYPRIEQIIRSRVLSLNLVFGYK